MDRNISEFQINKPYQSLIIVTNFAQKSQNINLMYQIPQGSISLRKKD